MFIAIVTFEGFNEIDSMVALNLLGRVRKAGDRIALASHTPKLTSRNGVRVHAQATLQEACEADAVIVGSGIHTLAISKDVDVMSQLKFDPTRQLIGSQCSGALLLAKLGLLRGVTACTDLSTKPWVEKAGIQIVNQPFIANGNVATAGGCLASIYMATWVIARTQGLQAARTALNYIVPVGEQEHYISRAVDAVCTYLPAPIEASTRAAG